MAERKMSEGTEKNLWAVLLEDAHARGRPSMIGNVHVRFAFREHNFGQELFALAVVVIVAAITIANFFIK